MSLFIYTQIITLFVNVIVQTGTPFNHARMWINPSATIRRVLRNPSSINGGLSSPQQPIPSDEEDPSVHDKSNKAIIDYLKRMYDANQDGVWQDEEVDNMLNDCVELTKKSEALESENSVILGKVSNYFHIFN